MAKKNSQPEVVEPVVDVEGLLSELTKKNDEYVFKLRRILKEHEYTDAQEHKVLAELLPEMVEAQRAGKPATQIFGPVTVKADSIINAPKPVKEAPFWLSVLDLSLFFASIFGLMYGVMAYIKPKQMTAGSGVASIIVMALMAGLIFSYYNGWSRKAKDQRPKTWLVMLGGVAAVLVASLGSSFLAVIKSPLTSPTTWPVYAGVAVVCYGAHWLLKRQFKLPGIMADAARR